MHSEMCTEGFWTLNYRVNAPSRFLRSELRSSQINVNLEKNVIHVNNIFNDIGGQFTAGVNYTCGQFAACIVFGGARIELWISLWIFQINWNYTNRNGPGGESWKKFKLQILWHFPFK